jgi:accessory gene regulator B
MFRIKNVCEKISNLIAQELNFDEDKKSVVNYGLFAFIQMIICIALVIIFGTIFNVVIEALIISFSISILRKSSGGVHASSPEKCAIIGTVSSVGMGVLSKYISVDFSTIIVVGVGIFIWSFYTINKLAPIDSIAKPIKNAEKRKKLKKNSLMILSIYLAVVIINFIYFYLMRNSIVLVYSLCIYMGLLWQVFSLTKYSYLLVRMLDKFI